MHSELCNTLLSVFLSGEHPNSDFVLYKVWSFGGNMNMENTNKVIIINGMFNQYRKNRSSLSRLLEVISGTLSGLLFVCEYGPFVFSLELACLAFQKGVFQDLDAWYRRKMMTYGSSIIKPSLDLLYEVLERKNNPNNLKQESLVPILNILGEQAHQLQGQFLQDLKKLKSNISEQPLQFFPRVIEDRANNYFLQIYKEELSIKKAIEILTQFQNSHDKRDQDTFACMIRSLFDEYKFFPKYPEKELKITAVLFGQLIQNQLLNYLPLEIALRYVIEALRKTDTNMFNFGFIALEQFKSRLCEWPQYCALLIQIPSLKPIKPLMEYIELCMIQGRNTHVPISMPPPQGIIPPSQPTPLIIPQPEPSNFSAPPVNFEPEVISPIKQTIENKRETPSPIKPKRIGLGVDVSFDQLFTSIPPVSEPDESIKNKINFIFNSIAQNNVESKVKEFLECGMSEEYLPYFARYIISKRVSQKINFHNEYISFLDSLKFKQLPKLILSETITNINLLLNAEEQSSHHHQRTLLKNLGFWLGMITLERNKAIRHRDLPLKQIIIDAYEQGKLFAVIPFVVNIFSRSVNSKVFKVPNVWLMAHISLLAEIWHIPELKFTIKHTIDHFLKSLGISLKNIQPSALLVNKTPHYGKNNLDWTVPDQLTEVSDEQKLIQQIANFSAEQTISNLSNLLRINSPFFKQYQQLQKFVLFALEVSIREAIQGIVERSYTIALCATKELITQDFSTELDENKMRVAAISMCQNLSSNIASFSGRFHLSNSISKYLRAYLLNEFKEITPVNNFLLIIQFFN